LLVCHRYIQLNPVRAAMVTNCRYRASNLAQFIIWHPTFSR